MTWLWIVLVGWLLVSPAAAVLIGRGVRIADRRRGVGREAVPFVRIPRATALAVLSGGRRAG